MTVTDKAWQSYIKKLSAINRKAAKIMQDWISVNGLDYPEELISYAYGIVGKYGEAAGSLACEMYDTLARAQGKILPDAVPAEPASYSEVARAVIGTKKVRPGQVPDTVARLVKQTAADTTLQNAKRDGAQFAWIPHGDTCSFCITLASRGWQNMSKNALKNGHAEHIHANCDCEYGVRFDGKSNVAGYDPDKYLEQYNNAEGTKPQDKINSMRREQYKINGDKIREQKREAYSRRVGNDLTSIDDGNRIIKNDGPDFYIGMNGKALPAVYKDWIGDNQMQERLNLSESESAKRYIRTDYRPKSFIGDGSTADIREFELATGLKCGRNGGDHSQKVRDLIRQIDKLLTNDLPINDRAMLLEMRKRLEGVNR